MKAEREMPRSNVCCAWSEPSTLSDISFHRGHTELPLQKGKP